MARPSGDILIINASNGLALDVQDNSMAVGGVIHLFPLDEDANQGWMFEPATSGNTGNAKFPVAQPAIELETSPNPDGGSDVAVTGFDFPPSEKVLISGSNYPENAGITNEDVQTDAQGTLASVISTNLPVQTLSVSQAETMWVTVTVQLPNGGEVVALGLVSFVGFVATNN